MKDPQVSHREMVGAVAFAVRHFALSTRWETAAAEVLARLGEATESSRVYIFENTTDPSGRLCMDEAFEWVAPGIPTTIQVNDNHNWPYEEGYEHYVETLGTGGVLQRLSSEVEDLERADFEEEGILSTLFVPIFVADEWWGYMGFDDCVQERRWGELETEILRTAAAILGAAVRRQRLQDMLMEVQERFRLLVETVPAVLYIDEPGEEMTTSYVSPQLEPLLGITQNEWMRVADTWETNMHPDDRERTRTDWLQAMKSSEPFSQEYRMIHRVDGRVVWIRDDTTFLTDASGEIAKIQGLMYDITEQKRAESNLELAQQQYRALVEEIPAVVYLDPVDENESSIYVSPQVETILGVTPEEWLGNPTIWRELLHPDDVDDAFDRYERQVAAGEPIQGEYRMIRPDGRQVWIREEAVTLLNEDGEPYLTQGLMHDITASKEAEAQIAFLAYHDALTGLANRAMFEEMLEPALARARRNDLGVSVLFMDLDMFKPVNDTWGHDAGDELLQQVAERLLDSTRETDLVARQGGDEFLVLLSDLDLTTEPGGALEVAQLLAERIRRAMKVPFKLSAAEIQTSASIGVSIFPMDADDARSLLKNADSAMYESKKAKRGSVVVHEMTESESADRDLLVRSLRSAVKHKPWSLHYQPSVDMESGKITSVEALLRWKLTEGGFVPPGEFLPLAEEMGLIEIIGEWVFEEICRQQGEWLEKGIKLPIGFNLSLRQLWQRDLVQRLSVGMRASDLDPKDIIIEVSEATAMLDPARAKDVLIGLNEEGFRIAIDDFGAGYTPPDRIRGLPMDILKIDQPLIREVPDDPEVDSFIRSVVAFGADLGCQVHAEGVETETQRAFLVASGCTSGQGYLFSRPLPAQDLMQLLIDGGGSVPRG